MGDLLTMLLIAVAGGVGSALRYLVDNALPARVRARFPWGTYAVNLTGSLALGLLTGLAPSDPWAAVLATGLLGGYTTFSAASLESVELLRRRRYLAALGQGPGMLVACVAVAVAGIVIAGG